MSCIIPALRLRSGSYKVFLTNNPDYLWLWGGVRTLNKHDLRVNPATFVFSAKNEGIKYTFVFEGKNAGTLERRVIATYSQFVIALAMCVTVASSETALQI